MLRPLMPTRGELLRLSLLLLACLSLVFAQAPERNITIPTPTSVAISRSAAGNSTNSVSLSGNATATASGNSTGSNSTATRTTSTIDPTKPFATDFQTETYRVPAPAGPGGGKVAQSPDDSVSALLSASHARPSQSNAVVLCLPSQFLSTSPELKRDSTSACCPLLWLRSVRAITCRCRGLE